MSNGIVIWTTQVRKIENTEEIDTAASPIPRACLKKENEPLCEKMLLLVFTKVTATWYLVDYQIVDSDPARALLIFAKVTSVERVYSDRTKGINSWEQ